jgi:hypothetical protein
MRRFLALVLILSLGIIFVVSGQPSKAMPPEAADDCSSLVRQALTVMDGMCQTLGRNQACYGHTTLQAQPQPNAPHFEFAHEGDIADVALLQSLRLGAMDTVSNAWGVAVMRIQASVPDSLPDQNVTLLMFGDVEIQNRMTEVSNPQVVTVNAERNLNVRQLPASDAWIIGSIAPGESVTATGRVEDGSWVRISLPDNKGTGWVASWLIDSADGLDNLAVVDAYSKVYGPMQAFYLTSGQHDSICAEAPDSGLLIQTPEGVAEVSLLINEVDIQIGSTVYFQAQPGGDMTIRVVEGAAHASAAGITYKVIAGTETTIPMDENLNPAGPPSRPRPYDMAEVQALPMDSLERKVQIHPPASPEELATIPPPTEALVPGEGQPAGVEGTPAAPGASADSATEAAPVMVVICHIVNVSKSVTLTVNEDAVAGHLGHGDVLGSCP